MTSDYNSLTPEDGYSPEPRPVDELAVEGVHYRETMYPDEEHFDQISPLAGLQETPEGDLVPAVEPPPIGASVAEQESYQVAAPALPPQYGAGFQDTVAEQLAKQREQLAQPAGNVDIKGMRHFERLVDEVPLCGGCGESFPCDGWKGLTRAQQGEQPPANRMDAGHPDWRLPTLEEAAQAAGVSVQEYMQDLHLRRHTGRL